MWWPSALAHRQYQPGGTTLRNPPVESAVTEGP
jgi:hypothetical protein